jgi:hypothetical protein
LANAEENVVSYFAILAGSITYAPEAACLASRPSLQSAFFPAALIFSPWHLSGRVPTASSVSRSATKASTFASIAAASPCVKQPAHPTFSPSGGTLHVGGTGGSSVYVRTPAPVRVPDPPGSEGESLGPAGCEVEVGDVYSTIASADLLRAKLAGVWFDCKQAGASAPFGPPDAAALEFTTDDQWFFLRRRAGGELTRVDAPGYAGAYEIIDTSLMNGPGHFQLNVYSGPYTQILQWALSDAPRKLRVDNMGVQQAVYSRMP